VVDRVFEPRLGQTKDYKIGISSFSAKHAALRRKSKEWLARNRDSVSEWGNVSVHGLLFHRIIEKIYHHTNSPILSIPYRTDRELLWIKELGTAVPYGCNDNIKGVGNLSSPGCSEINVMSLFNTIPRAKRSHGHTSECQKVL